LIIDTSALVAVARGEDGWERLAECMYRETGFIPTPVIFEFHRVTSERFNEPLPAALELLDHLSTRSIMVLALTIADADRAAELNRRYGTGNESGGSLNLLDLMVYAISEARNMPILCTGADFRAAKAKVHPASRPF
jgi:uncharacterized protein with PIN domain